jgi:aryl-alcohol dehydrogenase-like predicted oxidoreductase
MNAREIPSTGERLPVIGLGTWRGFDVAPSRDRYRELPAVLDALFDAGGRVIDSSPMYGRAERTIGELLAERAQEPRPFLATKVWTSGRADGVAQMENSFRLLRADRVDLMQIHNLVDWRTHLPTLREWKDAGRIRYLGITHYAASAYAAVEETMRAERFDVLQINYSLGEREAERRILPLAGELGMGVLVNRPFGGGGMLRRLQAEPLPGWAAELGATSWSQLALAFALSHDAVTGVIPGTGNPHNMADDAAAGSLPRLTEAQRRELLSHL